MGFWGFIFGLCFAVSVNAQLSPTMSSDSSIVNATLSYGGTLRISYSGSQLVSATPEEPQCNEAAAPTACELRITVRTKRSAAEMAWPVSMSFDLRTLFKDRRYEKLQELTVRLSDFERPLVFRLSPLGRSPYGWRTSDETLMSEIRSSGPFAFEAAVVLGGRALVPERTSELLAMARDEKRPSLSRTAAMAAVFFRYSAKRTEGQEGAADAALLARKALEGESLDLGLMAGAYLVLSALETESSFGNPEGQTPDWGLLQRLLTKALHEKTKDPRPGLVLATQVVLRLYGFRTSPGNVEKWGFAELATEFLVKALQDPLLLPELKRELILTMASLDSDPFNKWYKSPDSHKAHRRLIEPIAGFLVSQPESLLSDAELSMAAHDLLSVVPYRDLDTIELISSKSPVVALLQLLIPKFPELEARREKILRLERSPRPDYSNLVSMIDALRSQLRSESVGLSPSESLPSLEGFIQSLEKYRNDLTNSLFNDDGAALQALSSMFGYGEKIELVVGWKTWDRPLSEETLNQVKALKIEVERLQNLQDSLGLSGWF